MLAIFSDSIIRLTNHKIESLETLMVDNRMGVVIPSVADSFLKFL